MTDVGVAVPLHFTLEAVGLAVSGVLLGWALQRRARLLAAGGASLFASAVLHTGQFVTGEHDALVLALRVGGLVAVLLGLREGAAHDRPDERRGAPQAAAAGGGAAGLAWLSGALALLVATGHARLADRGLWAAAWAALGLGELWSAAVGGGPVLLGDDVGAHLVRTAGWGLLGVWIWRRTVTSLRSRVVAAFALVLFVVVVVVGGAVLRVGASNARDDELRNLASSVTSRRALYVSENQQLRDGSAVVSRTFSTAVSSGEDLGPIAQALRSQVFSDVDFIAFYGPDGRIQAADGLGDDVAGEVGASEAVQSALGGGDVPPVSLLALPERLVVVAAAPVRSPRSDGIIGAAVLGRVDGREALSGTGPPDGAAVLVVPGRVAIAASDPAFAGVSLPAPARDDLQAGRLWTGELSISSARYFGAAAPLTADTRDAGASPALLLLAPGGSVEDSALDVTRSLLAAILAATLVAVLIALWLSSRIARPVIDLTRTARRVEGGDLEAEPEVRTPDEIGELAGAFASMTASLRGSLAAEQDTRRRLETIVSGMGEGLVAMDADFNVITFNEAAEAITGVKADKAIGRKCYDVYGKRTAGRGGAICDYICPLRHDGGRDGAVAFRGRRDRRLDLAVTCSVLRGPDGEIAGGVDLLRDVTGEREAERAKDFVVTNIGHELAQPLSGVLGGATLLEREGLGEERVRTTAAIVASSAQRLKRLVEKLQDFTRIRAGQFAARTDAVSAGDLVSAAVERHLQMHASPPVETKLPARPPAVQADARLVERALIELLDNAVKALKFAGSSKPVIVRVERSDDGVAFSVADRGPGIEADLLDRVTEEFVTGEASGKVEGLGLGLSYVRQVVDAHGGTLDIDTGPKKGTTVTFVLPAPPEARKAAKRSVAKKETVATKEPVAKKKKTGAKKKTGTKKKTGAKKKTAAKKTSDARRRGS